jgi:hypothetical protein
VEWHRRYGSSTHCGDACCLRWGTVTRVVCAETSTSAELQKRMLRCSAAHRVGHALAMHASLQRCRVCMACAVTPSDLFCAGSAAHRCGLCSSPLRALQLTAAGSAAHRLMLRHTSPAFLRRCGGSNHQSPFQVTRIFQKGCFAPVNPFKWHVRFWPHGLFMHLIKLYQPFLGPQESSWAFSGSLRLLCIDQMPVSFMASA